MSVSPHNGDSTAGIDTSNQKDPQAKRVADSVSIPQEIWHSVVIDAPYGIVLLDRHRKIIFFNEVIYRTIASQDIPPEKMLGMDFYGMVDTADQGKVRAGIEKAFQNGAFSSYLSRGLDPRRRSWYQGRIGPVRLNGEIVAASVIAKNITKQKLAEEALKKAHEELERRVDERTEALLKTNEQLIREIEERGKIEAQLKIKSENLEDANSALTFLLKKRQEDQKELEEKVLSNMKILAMPYLEKLKGMGLNERQMAYASILETSLNDIISPFSHNLSLASSGLSPAEISVANLIRADKTSKEIADIMSLSVRTIEGHRDKIRKKLRIKNNKINLRAHLQSLDGLHKPGADG